MSEYVSCTSCHQVQPQDELIHGRFCSYCHGTTFSAATEDEYEGWPKPITVLPVSTTALEDLAKRVIERFSKEEA